MGQAVEKHIPVKGKEITPGSSRVQFTSMHSSSDPNLEDGILLKAEPTT